MSCTKSMPGTQRIGQGSSSLEGSAEGTVAGPFRPAQRGDDPWQTLLCYASEMRAYRRAIPGAPDPGLAASYGVEVIWRVAKGPKDQGSNDPGPEPPWEPS